MITSGACKRALLTLPSDGRPMMINCFLSIQELSDLDQELTQRIVPAM